MLPGELMGVDGFQLSITLSEVHLPRMWVEKHPDKDSQVRPAGLLSEAAQSPLNIYRISEWVCPPGLHVGVLSGL